MDRRSPSPAAEPAVPATVDEAELLGLDNVAVALPIAGLGSRLLAATVDYLLLALAFLLWLLAVTALVQAGLVGSTAWIFAVLGIGAFLLQWGFFLAFEMLTGGRTPGKLMLGLRTVGRDGGAASATALTVRNLLRAVDVLVAPLLFYADPLARRLGDRLAGTLVAHEAVEHADAVSLGRVPAGWGAERVALVEAFLARAPYLLPSRAAALGEALLARVDPGDGSFARRPGESPRETLARVLEAGGR